MKLNLTERKQLRGKIVQILETRYPQEVPLERIEATLEALRHWYGKEATRQETAWLEDSGFVSCKREPDPDSPRDDLCFYRLTANGHELATGELRDDSVVWFGA